MWMQNYFIKKYPWKIHLYFVELQEEKGNCELWEIKTMKSLTKSPLKFKSTILHFYLVKLWIRLQYSIAIFLINMSWWFSYKYKLVTNLIMAIVAGL